ncbi:NACHT domain-containing protein [Sphingobacterium sp. UDSM-2020]|uniref:NACHT domain-containing protein n=1 Tax=Sphingobacterium sp. UDSM-2020 TaxID=2795738 RepID=UPI001936D8A9|nr:hypothetical protein [Sphingobacterium sp. UDSM-2020]QQD12354.1 hypothetical protein JAZ75_17315 [Sphingobacterium sp. UDSM-2020]
MAGTAVLSLVTWVASKLADKGFDLILNNLQSNKNEIDKLFRDKIKTVSKKLSKEFPDVLGGDIDYFLRQDFFFEESIKFLFVNQVIDIEIISEKFDKSTLPKQFLLKYIIYLKEEVNKEIVFAPLLASKEIYITLNGIYKTIQEIAKSSNLQEKEIKQIQNLLESQFKSSFNIDNFLSNYLKVLENNVKRVNHIGLGVDQSIKRGKSKDLSAIFIPPYFILDSQYHKNKETKQGIKFDGDLFQYSNDDPFEDAKTKISFNDMFERPYNFVILGNPGAGKSLLLKSILLYICGDNKIKISDQSIKQKIPFRIELKNYLAYKKLSSGNIVKYISHSLSYDYSLSNILVDNLSTVFNEYETLVLFDGLDEIFDVKDKIEIKHDIENFHKIYQKVRSIVTSRFIGYNDAKLDDNNFCELSMLSFNSSQIKEYVKKWYELEEDDDNQRERESGDFIAKMSKVDNELLGNPLLLSLIVILYRNNLKIPESKLEIYQSCTNTLVDKWDAIKNLDIDLDKDILQKKEPIFSDLAHWQYEKLSSKEPNISFYNAKRTVANSLLKKNLADDDNCDILAESFLDYAQKRSIYFDNNFTHKTFLEYYTAYWLYSNIEKKHKTKERNKIIAKYIATPYWTIVLELFLNLIDKDQPDAEILDDIISQNMKRSSSFIFLLYVVNNLKNVSNSKVNDLLVAIFRYLLTTKGKFSKLKESVFSRLQTWSENEQQQLLITAFNSIHPKDDKELVDLLILQAEIMFFPSNEDDYNLLDSLKSKNNFEKLLNENKYLYTLVYFHEGFLLEKFDNYLEVTVRFINNFGVKELIYRNPPLYARNLIGKFFIYYWNIQINDKNINDLNKNLTILESNGVDLDFHIKFLIEIDFFHHYNIFVSEVLIKSFQSTKSVLEKRLYFLLILDSLNMKNFNRIRKNNDFDIKKSGISKELEDLLIKVLKVRNAKELTVFIGNIT